MFSVPAYRVTMVLLIVLVFPGRSGAAPRSAESLAIQATASAQHGAFEQARQQRQQVADLYAS